MGGSSATTSDFENKLQTSLKYVATFASIGSVIPVIGTLLGAVIGFIVSLFSFIKGRTEHLDNTEAHKIANAAYNQLDSILTNAIAKKFITNEDIYIQAEKNYTGLIKFLNENVPGNMGWLNGYKSHAVTVMKPKTGKDKFLWTYHMGLTASLRSADIVRLEGDSKYTMSLFLKQTGLDKFADGIVNQVITIIDKDNKKLADITGTKDDKGYKTTEAEAKTDFNKMLPILALISIPFIISK
jgi:hypothetical protein